MNAVEVYNTINKYLEGLRNTYGDNIKYIEAYDGKIIIYFKKDYVEEKNCRSVLKDFINKLFGSAIWGDNK